MCLIFTGVLLTLGINFYLDGFMIQAFVTAGFALVTGLFMIKNISNCKSACTLYKKEDKDDN